LPAPAIRHKVKLLTVGSGIAQLPATAQERQQHSTILD
jgi:hypothetical protein